MKLQVPKQFICYITAFILFLSGVWMEMPSTDVSFLYAQETTDMESMGSVLGEGEKSAKQERISTIDVFARDITACLSSNRVQNGMKRFARNVAFFTEISYNYNRGTKGGIHNENKKVIYSAIYRFNNAGELDSLCK